MVQLVPWSTMIVSLRTAVNSICLFVGYLDAELLLYISRQTSSALSSVGAYLLDGHDDLDGVETVQSQVIRKVCLWLKLNPGQHRLQRLGLTKYDRSHL